MSFHKLPFGYQKLYFVIKITSVNVVKNLVNPLFAYIWQKLSTSDIIKKKIFLGDTGKQKTTEDHGASLGNTTESCSPLSQNHLQTQPIRSGLWCEQDHVIKSGIVETMTGPEKMLQEALFEVGNLTINPLILFN